MPLFRPAIAREAHENAGATHLLEGSVERVSRTAEDLSRLTAKRVESVRHYTT